MTDHFDLVGLLFPFQKFLTEKRAPWIVGRSPNASVAGSHHHAKREDSDSRFASDIAITADDFNLMPYPTLSSVRPCSVHRIAGRALGRPTSCDYALFYMLAFYCVRSGARNVGVLHFVELVLTLSSSLTNARITMSDCRLVYMLPVSALNHEVWRGLWFLFLSLSWDDDHETAENDQYPSEKWHALHNCLHAVSLPNRNVSGFGSAWKVTT
jgi:hypothetical protein